MVASRRGCKPTSGKENVGELNRNKTFQGDNVSQFQVLDQIQEETFNRVILDLHVLVDAYPKFQATTSKDSGKIPANAKPSKSAN
ncbi:hypothetical protein WN943_006750 [Citrus x changshan-huyou]